MDVYRVENVVRTERLRSKYGNEVVLTEDGAEERDIVHEIVMEFDLAGRSYAVLRPAEAGEDAELSVFRVTTEDGEERIETIEDDEEWENISELVDELTLAGEAQDNVD